MAGLKVYGSLIFLKGMKSLELLAIDGTELDSDIEHLPENLRIIYCDNNGRCKEIKEKLEKYGVPSEYEK